MQSECRSPRRASRAGARDIYGVHARHADIRIFMQDISAPPAHAEPAPRKKARIKLAVRLVVSAGLVVALVFGVRGVHLGEVASRLSAFPVSGVALALGAGLLQVLAQLVRLWSLFPRGARPRLSTVGRGFAWGQLLNMFLPARAGEVVKVVSIARAQPIPGAPQPTMTQTTGAILADKIVDLVTMLALGLCMLPQLLTLPLPSPRTLAMVLPLAGFTTSEGVEAGLTRIVDAAGAPVSQRFGSFDHFV